MKKWAVVLSAATLAFGSHHIMAKEGNTVYLYTWSEYVPEGLLDDFTKQTGIKVIVSSLESNETMYAKLKTMGKNQSYDVIAPTSYFVSKMAREGMLKELDHSKLPVLSELDPQMLDRPFDKGNKYSVPQLFGATGIAYNTETQDPANFQSWADLWKPEFKDALQLLDDPREAFNIALLKMGQDPNTQDPAILKAAYEELLKLRPNILAFNSDNPSSSFISGEVEIGTLWNGSVRIAKNEGAKINMVYPKEGTPLWIDNLAIPATSQNPEGAYKLINYMLSAPVAAKLTKAIGYPTANKVALAQLPKDLVEDPAVFIRSEVIEKSPWQVDVGDAIELYEKYYQDLKTAK
ncbi:extracellular solute-binding protein [Glaesserella parasuis]|uniref:Putrescine-binding periplasmic protein n=2 Tax=Glaesserella parasuis TaxID=738 RepID=A0A836MDJ0_GLAPU|nr:extracellular solute-binding protein [Glaesserella parasuis]EPZ99860.1 bacterial extracellular solute-binding family protein [Glaesserella parasuis MN-H]AMW16543.1 spermidine/putrescine ABC transporter substrate-binding protein [Glaesserella parasuis]KDB46842.1 spermidine/putrescine ABC transporter substrate-binding protein [Glaesserella parasuis HPS11]KDB47340.1 spermidine/putrescine ABC transporter substrate-binding protein [Glaesserella parasuis HPS10]MCT8518302.1 extracellular solute-bi